ncbi:MAG: ABC transporter substrate-binding protein [Xanthobacteraceae bacterium]
MLLGLVLFASCNGALSAFAQDKIRLVFPTTPTTLFLPYYVAQQKGWLPGLAIEESYVTGDSNAIRAVLSDQADFGAGVGTFAVLSALEAGADLKAVGSWSPLPDYNVVIAAGKGKTVADLAGKIIATSGPGALPDQLPRILMRKYNVDDTSAKFIQVGGHPVRLQAVLGGRADATLVNTVTALDSIETGAVSLVARISKEFPKLGYVWNVARVSTLADEKKRAAVQLLTTAGIRGAQFIMQSPEEAAAILHQRVSSLGLDLSLKVIKDLNNDGVWGTDGGLNPGIIEYTIATGSELRVLKRQLASASISDTTFVDTAMKSVGPVK